MNILFQTSISPLSKQSIGGAETSIRLMADFFSERNHQVVWLTRMTTNKPWFIKKNSFLNKIKVISYQTARGAGTIRLINVWNNWNEKNLIKKIILDNKIDILYCYYDISFIKKILKIRKDENFNFKIVMRMAGLYWYEQCKLHPEMINDFESIFNQIDSVNYIHPSLENMVEEKFIHLKMNVTFKHKYFGDIGSSVNFVRKNQYTSEPDSEFLMIMATRFSNYQKRQDVLVRALSLVDKKIPFRLLFIGNGSEKDKIKAMIQELNLSDKVEIIPHLEQDVLWNKLLDADLLCHACDYEGLSKIIIESMSVGLPVLASDVPPLNNYIVDNENGFLVNNTEQEWAAKIEKIFYDREKLISVSQQSMLYANENYNPEINIVKLENYFTKLLS
jgi:glycosyltransferase involved in cell wall biosynthesis